MRKSSIGIRLLVPMLVLAFVAAFVPVALASGGGVDPDDVDETFGRADLESATVALSQTTFTYTGKEIVPTVTVTKGDEKFVNGVDYALFYMDNLDVGQGRAVVWSYDENTSYNVTKYFKINPADASKMQVSVPNAVYTGKQIKPAPVVRYNGITLKKGTDYNVSYGANKKTGKGTVTITGKGNFTGKTTKTFKITKASLKNVKFSKIKAYTYAAKKLTPNVKLKFRGKKLKKNRDYTVKYKNNKNAGIAKIVVKGKGNFKGKHTLNFTINPRSLSDSKVTVSMPAQTYTGKTLSPKPTIKYKKRALVNGKDYVITNYKDTDKVGSAQVVVRGKGNFKDKCAIIFTINPASLQNAKITVYVDGVASSKIHAGRAYTLKVTFGNTTLAYDTDFKYSTKLTDNNKNVEITITAGSGDNGVKYFTGSKTQKFEYVPAS